MVNHRIISSTIRNSRPPRVGILTQEMLKVGKESRELCTNAVFDFQSKRDQEQLAQPSRQETVKFDMSRTTVIEVVVDPQDPVRLTQYQTKDYRSHRTASLLELPAAPQSFLRRSDIGSEIAIFYSVFRRSHANPGLLHDHPIERSRPSDSLTGPKRLPLHDQTRPPICSKTTKIFADGRLRNS